MNQTLEVPQYFIDFLNKGMPVKNPRAHSKEVDLYIYSTNQSLRTIDTAKEGTVINIIVKLSQVIKFQPTNQSAEFSLPKSSEDPSGSSFWTHQIAGWVFENIDVDKSQYFFVSREQLSEKSVASADKFRINRYVPIFRGKEVESWEILGVLETARSFKAIDSAKWTFEEEEVELRTRIKAIEFEFDPTALISANGIQILTKASPSSSFVRNSISKIERAFGYIFKIELATKNPLTINFTEWQHFYEDSLKGAPDHSGWENFDWIILAWDNVISPSVEFLVNHRRTACIAQNETWVTAQYKSILGNPNLTGSKKYFNQIYHEIFEDEVKKVYHHKFWMFKDDNGFEKKYEEIRRFFNGNYTDQGFPFPEIPEKWSPVSEIKKYRDLDANIEKDRQFMVFGSPIAMDQFWTYDTHGLLHDRKYYRWKSKHNFELLNKEEQSNYLHKPTPTLIIRVELSRMEISPQIVINAVHANWVRINLWDENSNWSGPQEFSLNGSKDPNNFKTTIFL